MENLLRRFFLVIMFLPFISMAEDISVENEIKFNEKVWQLLNEYEYTSTIFDEDCASRFKSLFLNEDVWIYNDLLGISSVKELPVKEYAQLMLSNVQSPMIVLKNVKKQPITDLGDSWEMKLECMKSISYLTNCGVYFSSEEYYKTDHKLVITFVMDKNTSECSIVGINGSIDSSTPNLPKEYKVLQRSSELDDEVLYGGEKVKFNSFNQAFLLKNAKFEVNDNDVKLKVETNDCGITTLKYLPTRWRVKPYVNIPLMDTYNIGESNITSKMSSIEYGVDFGYIVPSKSKLKFGIFAGLSLSNTSIDLGLDKLNYNYSAESDADVDADYYTRYYEIKNISQSHKISSLAIPISVDLDYRFSKIVSIYARAGIESYIALSQDVTNASADIYTYGIYSKYGNLLIDDPYINNFGASSVGLENISENTFNLKRLSFDAILGLGFRFNVIGPLALDLGLNYQLGLTECIESPENLVNISSDRVNKESALITYTVAENESMRSLMDMFDAVKRQSLNLNIGLIFKF